MMGIYIIKNEINGHTYVGSSVDIKKRWREHKARSKIKSKWYIETYYSHLYCAFRKYGIENFSFSVLEEVSEREKLLEREKYWYFVYNPEYNNMIPDRVGVCCGAKHTQETKNKISKNNAKYWKGKKLPKDMVEKIIEGNKNKRIQVSMISIDTGEVLKNFDGICNALRYLDRNPNNTQLIKQCCEHNPKYKTAYGYKWEYR